MQVYWYSIVFVLNKLQFNFEFGLKNNKWEKYD